MGKHAGAFKSEKRKKELKRMQKSEEKRQKRLKKDVPLTDAEQPEQEGMAPESHNFPDNQEQT